MAGIKETPTNFRVYYTSMKDAYTQKKEEASAILVDLNNSLKDLYNIVSTDFNNNKKDFPINLEDYPEYINNKYIDNTFLRVAKGILINHKGNYEAVGRNFDIYKLAKLQKDIFTIKKDIAFYDKILDISIKEYQNLLKLYYTTVQKKLILDGYGYVFDGRIGWICINRCHIKSVRPHIDYKATNERKRQLLKEGKRIYNKEEAEWCEQNGVEYKAEDVRVFQKLEYVYEIPLIGCKTKGGDKVKFETSDYRGRSIRGKKNDDLLKESGGDKNKILDIDVDIRTKLYLCIESDKLLYAKFIRNESQEPSTVKPSNRKN